MVDAVGRTAYCASWIRPLATGKPVPGAAVLVDSGRVIAVVGQQEIPAGYRRVDLGQQWLLPGLIDAHVHLVWDGGPEPDLALRAEAAELSAIKAATRARQHLMNGVTTVRDLGGPFRTVLAVRDAICQGIVTGARVIAAGNLIARTDPGEPMRLPVATPDQARGAVRELLEAGVDVIKLMATGGVYHPDDDLGAIELGLAELAAAVDEAHNAGRKVAVHAYHREGIGNAIAAGADTLEHACFLDSATARLAAAGGQIVVPTLTAYRRYLEAGPDAGLPPQAVGKAREAVAAGRAAIGYALAHGIPIAAGTDAGGRCKPHGCLAWELRYLVEAGLTPAAALAAATTVAARTCGLADVGEIRSGYRADLIAVGADPVADISALGEVRTVIAGGRLVKSGSPGEVTASPSGTDEQSALARQGGAW